MVKILAGEIVSDNDPRVLALEAHQRHLYEQQQQVAEQHHQQQVQQQQQQSHSSSPHYLTPSPPPSSSSSSSFYGYNYNPYNPYPNYYPSHSHSPSLHPSLHSSAASSSSSNSSSSSSSSSSKSSSSSSSSCSPYLEGDHGRRRRVHDTDPYSYNVFGLPPVQVLDITIYPHWYLMAGLCVWLIGPKALVFLVFGFFTYRWHLNNVAKEEAKRRADYYPAHFKKPFAYKPPPPPKRVGIMSIHDLPPPPQQDTS